MSRINFALATQTDDAELRRLLRENPVSGAISLTFEREPCYFRAAAVEGPFHQTIIGREAETGEIVGMGSRSVRPVYLNGAVQSVGYMSHLRANLKRPWGLSLARNLAQGFEFCHRLHADGRAPFYLMSVIADNQPARRLLSSGLPGMPRPHEYARLYTYAVAPARRKRPLPLPVGLRLARGNAGYIDAIVDCLQRNGARRQFFPYWTTDTLCSPDQTPGLAPEDFFLALDGERVVGCLALWDQDCIKQTVVRGYAGAIARWRWLINIAARWGGWPILPPPPTPLRYCCASHLACDDDDPAIFAALLRAFYNAVAERGYDYFMLGLSSADPLRAVVIRTYRYITYTSQLYLVAWEDGLEAVSQVDARTPGPELALL